MLRRSLPVLLPLLVAVVAGACDDGPTAPPGQAQYRVRDVHAQAMTVRIADPGVAAQADQLLASGQERWVMGRLRSGSGGFNQPWRWHLDPSTIQLAEVTIEACQTTIRGVEDDLEYWIAFDRTVGPICIGGVFVSRQ